ncbi:hypothetical protein ML401_35085 (plasmid) [Bradyrhizobium sp. 62B]|uniref:hypothetical protein n=1 Tax=Bradyrhizobium sp. 62B TaxID=2898442 RepID=UPI002557D2E6|nr:hypothetical protein ML401_35085 [Bradyrhizobium sp. 62B]
MTRLPQHALGPGASFQRLNVDDQPPTITPTTARGTETEIERTHASGGQSFEVLQDGRLEDLLGASTIETALELNSIHPVSRIAAQEAPGKIGRIEPGSALGWLNGTNLAGNLLSFVAPRLCHSDVLRPDTQGLLLERLAETLSAVPENLVPREDIAILQSELRRLTLLRQNQNGLIKG